MKNIEHNKISIEYIRKDYSDQGKTERFIVCDDCPYYAGEEKILLNYDNTRDYPDIRQAVKDKLKEHNEIVGGKLNVQFLKVQSDSVIKYYPRNDLWGVVYNNNGKEIIEFICPLTDEKVKEAWKELTEKVLWNHEQRENNP